MCVPIKVGETARGVIYRCGACGFTFPPVRVARLERYCPSSGVDVPPLTTRGELLLSASQRWLLAGKPERSDAEVLRIATECCQPCRYFRNGACGLCGCPCRTPAEESADPATLIVGRALRNKIRMQTEDCPLLCARCSQSRWRHLDGTCEFQEPGR